MGVKKRGIIPSSNDHKFNQNKDAKLNRKVLREGTPYKGSSVYNPNKKASLKPNFATSFTETSVSKSGSVGDDGLGKDKIPKKKLAFDPDKVKSRLFENTSSSQNKMRNRKGSQTPMVRSNNRNKVKVRSGVRNWTAV